MSNEDSQRELRDDVEVEDLEVSGEQAEEVSGGLNPQPLPPIVRDGLNPQPLPPIVP